MAECAILHAGGGGVTVRTSILLGELTQIVDGNEVYTSHCMPGYCDGGEYARYYWPLGALPVVFERSFVSTSQIEYMGDNSAKYRITKDIYHLKITAWQGDTIGIARVRPYTMSAALSAEPSAPTISNGRIYYPLIDDILAAIEAQEEQLSGGLLDDLIAEAAARRAQFINDLLEQFRTSKTTKSGVTTYTVPCLAALRLDIETGETFPAFVGASAAAVTLTRSYVNMTRDNVVYDDEFAAVTRTDSKSKRPRI